MEGSFCRGEDEQTGQEPLLEEGIIFWGIDFFLIEPFLWKGEKEYPPNETILNASPIVSPLLKWHSLAYLSLSV